MQQKNSSSGTDCDQVSEVSFMEDTDEDVDTNEIEEIWIEYLTLRTTLAVEKNEDSQNPLLDYDTQKDEMEIRNEDLFSTRDEMVKKNSKNGMPEETEETNGNDLKNNDTWIRVAKDPKKMERNGKNIISGTSQNGAEVYRNERNTSE